MTLLQEREAEITFCATRTRLMISQGKDDDAKAAAVLTAQAVKRWLELPLLTSCAWCGKVLTHGRTDPDGGSSHGICPACFDHVIEEDAW